MLLITRPAVHQMASIQAHLGPPPLALPESQVGNRLGAGDAEGARAAATAAVSVAPFAWLLAAVPLLHPVSQAWLIHAFSDPGQGPDARLEACLVHMFQVRHRDRCCASSGRMV